MMEIVQTVILASTFVNFMQVLLALHINMRLSSLITWNESYCERIINSGLINHSKLCELEIGKPDVSKL